MFTASDIKKGLEKAGVSRDMNAGLKPLDIETKAPGTTVSPNPGARQFIVPDGIRLATASASPFGLRTLVPEVRVESGAITVAMNDPTWYQVEGSAAVVAEDASKPSVYPHITSETYKLETVAARMKVSAEFLEDYDRLAEFIADAGVAAKNQIVNEKIARAANDAVNANTDMSSWGRNPIWSAGQKNFMEVLSHICGSGFSPNAIVFYQNRTAYGSIADSITTWLQDISSDYKTLYDADGATALKLGTGLASYGGINVSPGAIGYDGEHMTVLGIPIYFIDSPSSYAYAGLGDFAHGIRLYTRGTKIEVGYDGDDWSHDKATIRVSERITPVVINRYAFGRISTTHTNAKGVDEKLDEKQDEKQDEKA